MTSNNTNKTSLPFRPLSLRDFSRYAKHLAWVIQEPLQSSQNLLAKIYGYSGFYELKKVMEQTTGEPGPFLFTGGHYNRILKIIKDHREAKDKALNERDCAAMEIGLFERPEWHRKHFDRHKQKMLVLSGEDRRSPDLTVSDYATVAPHFDAQRQYVLLFTKLGRGIYDAAIELIGFHRFPDLYIREQKLLQLLDISHRHPNNPWPFSLFFIYCAFDKTRHFHDMEEPYWYAPKTRRTNATCEDISLFEQVKHCVSLFEDIYCGHANDAANPNLVVTEGDYGGDTYCWPNLLFYGIHLALTLGEVDTSRQWLAILSAIEQKEGVERAKYILEYVDEIRARTPICSN